MGEFQDAQEVCLAFLQKQPHHVEAMHELAMLYMQTDQVALALTWFERVMSVRPDLPGLQNNRAMALQNLHRFDEAMQAYDYALQQVPEDKIAQANKAMLCLFLGHFDAGWPLYEARNHAASMALHPELNAFPRWNGRDSLTDKIIVLHPEQGYGDTIQFCRYAMQLASLAAQVILVVNKDLYTLIKLSVSRWPSAEKILVVSAGATIPAFHYQISIVSLAAVFNTRLENIPDPGPYIFAPESSVNKWSRKMPLGHKPRVGLVWAGSTKHANDKKRSLPLSELLAALQMQSQSPTQTTAPLGIQAEWEFHSLQKEISLNDQRLLQEQQIYQHSEDLQDFSDTAALIQQMDLVITVDTSVAHLACAMGKPCWILLASLPDFRWLQQREDSPWYASARLFRQELNSDWHTLLKKVVVELMSYFSHPSGRTDSGSVIMSLSTHARQQMQQGQWEDAERSYFQLNELQASSAIMQNNWGVVLQKLGRFEEALQRFDRAMQLAEDYVSPRINKAMCLLSLGQFDEGWRLYEWRWKNAQWDSSRRDFKQTLWLGQKLEPGSTLLIYAEQGLGDTIQFCRLLELVQERLRGEDVKLIFEVPASLFNLLRCLPLNVFARTAEPELMPTFDYQCPLLSLPLALNLQTEDIPSHVPYLDVGAEKVQHWRSKIASGKRLKVGLVWAGSPHHQNDKNRSISFATISPLLQLEADFYVLQKELSASEKTGLKIMQSFGRQIQILAPELEDFCDTAAVINCLDLLVCVDTSVAHLAGALGKPLYLLLPYEADFRWMHDRDDTPWYPTARLFRQSQIGDWLPVIAAVKAQIVQEILNKQTY
ncbi:tetratricopeptide repeat protein [Undibacterium danionis]|uniref:Tetratricopeptide repeat protein n=1 Tax=Undibacterium danionis TaxID=1812100 RepID=A0ABV6IAL2_9BURK